MQAGDTMTASCALRLVFAALLFAASAAFTPAAKAATTCTATSSTLAFGTVSTTGNTDVLTTFNVTCSTSGLAVLANAKVRMCLNIGDGVQGIGHFNPRRMLNASNDALQFQLYTDAARTQIWGSLGNPAAPTPLQLDFDYSVPLLGGSQTRQVFMYGRVPAQIFVAGAYSNAFTGIHTSMLYRYSESMVGPAGYPASCTAGGIGGASPSGAFPFTVSATVPSKCEAYATTDLDFGSVAGTIASNIDQTSTIGMTCTGRTAWQIGLNDGLNASGNTRRMRLGTTANYVTYELYRDPARSQRWGNALNADTLQGTGTGTPQTPSVHGRVPATQTPAAGNYSDTVVVTVTY
jgi:spore coat protein U-like protein